MVTAHFPSASLSSRAIRLRKIERALRSGTVVSGLRLREITQSSPATFKRDLDCLRLDFQAQIVYVPCELGYRLQNAAQWSGVAAKIAAEIHGC